MLKSEFSPLCAIHLPYAERRYKYHTFDLSKPDMPKGFEDYLDPVRALCVSAGAREGFATVTIDEKMVHAGMSQRRPRPHVDGCFMPQAMSWGHPPQWLHYCNDIGRGPISRMAVIVAASVSGCRAWKGTFKGAPASDGDLQHINDQLDEGQILPANVGYLLSPDCVHESMIFPKATRRTFLRIALPLSFNKK
jgi:hypothetical protein